MIQKNGQSIPVTVAVPWQSFHERQVVMGVMRYVTEIAGRWSVDLLAQPEHVARTIRGHGSIGVIVLMKSQAALRGVLCSRVKAAVAVLDSSGWDGLVSNISEEAVGRLAAEHLLNQGHRRFAVFDHPWPFARRRALAFCQRLDQAGMACERLPGTLSGSQRKDRMYLGGADRLAAALKRLPRPLAVFAPSDSFSTGIVRSCHDAGLRVPEDIAILGVDNDPMQCLMNRPWLSSVALPFDQVGYRAAQALDQLLSGRRVDRIPGVQPTGVVVRQSTDLLAVEDPDVAAVLRFVRERATLGITPADLLQAVPVSRRSLERRFRAALGRTIMSEIHRVRVERAKELLDSGDLGTGAIAERSGFLNASRLAIVFRRLTGLTPSGYRKRLDRPTA